jgi:4-amino-4-deoxy-L-arabinose transferase-like glycosyltransferase
MSEILTDKIYPFFRENFHFLVFIVFILAFVVRLKYFMINQALWFDEAEYLSIAKHWAFGIPYDIHPVRPILFSLFAAFFYKLGFGETFFRIGMLLFSFFGIVALYYLCKELYNQYIALIASFAMSFFFIHLFFTGRLLLGLPTTTLWIIIALVFCRGYIKKGSKYYVLVLGPLISLGVLIRFPLGLIAIAILIYLLIIEGFKFLKNKYLWISGFIAVIPLIPYFIWYYVKYGKMAILSVGSYYSSSDFFVWGYMKLFPSLYLYSKWHILLILFLIGLLVLLFNLVIGFDLIRKDKKLKSHLFVFLLLVIPFIYFSISQGHIEPRYLFYIFPSVFIILGLGTFKSYKFLSKYSKDLALVVILFALLFGVYTHYQFSDMQIKAKADSYVQLRDAGLWIKEHSLAGDKIISSGVPQLTYYSDREILNWPEEEEMEDFIKETGAKYMVLTLLERSPDWSYSWPENNKDKVVPIQAYLMENKQPILVIYQFI